MNTFKIKLSILLVILAGITVFYAGSAFSAETDSGPGSSAITIEYNGVKVRAVVEKPESGEVDVLLAFHGTTMDDSRTLKSAERMLINTRKIIKKGNILIISVAYPEEGLLMGDNLRECEAALLWVKNSASAELGVKINKIYLFGHSQGAYIVTRLNTMHATDGVIANAPGPIDLVFRCEFDEKGKVKYRGRKNAGEVCALLKDKYGSVFDNPASYRERSLINFACAYKSKILFIQGMKDKKIQLALWPKFRDKVEECGCQECEFLEIEGSGHNAAFESNKAFETINNFLS